VVLAIDTAGAAASVAVGCGDDVLAHERRELRHGHGEVLLPLIDTVMKRADVTPSALGTVAVAVGPGGFTGIRVGLAAAQGIALASGARQVGVTSFAAVAARIDVAAGAVLLVALDSRRADLYVQLFDAARNPRGEAGAILPEALAAWVGEAPLVIAGDAAEAAASALAGGPHIEIRPDSAPDALGVLAAARAAGAVVPARPLYLRPPDVTVAKRAAP
jgi:tRNA threonylcarbamoyladenosine biosynthesis protein TsaB